MYRFIKKLFARSKNRTANYADGLVQVAQLVIGLALTKYFKAKNLTTDGESPYQLASVWANYLFGKTPSTLHTNLDLSAEYAKALCWIENEGDAFQGIVVQGLRIINISGYSKTGEINLIGRDLLEKFGKLHPDAPDLEKYSAVLLLTIVGQLDQSQQLEIFNYIKTGPFASLLKDSKYFGWD